MKKTNIHIVSHTHWDREWYATFQEYRVRLVFLMDHLIDTLENVPEYKYFHLDGQTVMIEDYLQIRPENRERLVKLIRDGRIVIGPWYVMPDEFIVSGESLVRNLAKGFDICAEYGVAPLNCGYITDIFGHNNQMPQILLGFGIDSAMLFRGIAGYEKDMFIWQGADESEVLCLKLDKWKSYSNFYLMVRNPFEGKDADPEELVAKMRNAVDSFREQMAAC
jgi:mannosylglycerate hydrolase